MSDGYLFLNIFFLSILHFYWVKRHLCTFVIQKTFTFYFAREVIQKLVNQQTFSVDLEKCCLCDNSTTTVDAAFVKNASHWQLPQLLKKSQNVIFYESDIYVIYDIYIPAEHALQLAQIVVTGV